MLEDNHYVLLCANVSLEVVAIAVEQAVEIRLTQDAPCGSGFEHQVLVSMLRPTDFRLDCVVDEIFEET